MNFKIYSAVLTTGILITIVRCQMSGMAGMSPADHALLDSAVKQIVHPKASPTLGMIAVATAQGGPPTSSQQIMQYQPHMVSLARSMGVKPPGVTAANVPRALEQYILQRSLAWLQQRNTRTRGGGIFGNMGNWMARMMFFENFF